MAARPEVLLNRRRAGCKLSVILIDWQVRESFHSLHYLNRQTADRDLYELIWLEFYEHRPDGLRQLAPRGLDKWIVAGYPRDHVYHKHRLYNLGLLAAEGDLCVFCDSDALFTPNFVANLLRAFDETPRAVVHLDEIRNSDGRFYPFNYPTVEEVLGAGCINWHVNVSRGLEPGREMLHAANYGACMAAPRADLLAIGGADEHVDYLGYVCGPYEMTFRLANAGVPERWLRDEYLYHTWHPNESTGNADYQGPHDGLAMSLLALEARAIGRTQPAVKNPWIAVARRGELLTVDRLMDMVREKDEPQWRAGCQSDASGYVYFVERDFQGFNLFVRGGRWYGLKSAAGFFDPAQARRYQPLLQAKSGDRLRALITYYNQLPMSWWGKLRSQPLYRLPGRILKRIGREVRRRL
jgi:hypothetical protein